MDRNFNPFGISNKQAHNGNLTELRYGESGFSLTQVSRKWAANPYFSSSLTQNNF